MVRDIDLTLQSRQLRLNSAKTQILTQDDAFRHFCVKENSDLDRLAHLIETTAFFHILKPRIGAVLSKLYEKWLDRTPSGGPSKGSPFSQGNGTKIHKRIFTLLRKCDRQPPVDDLIWLIKNSPGMRSSAIRTLLHTNKPNEAFHKFLQILKSGLFVDDAAYMEFASFCVHAKFKRTPKLHRGILEAVSHLEDQGMIGAYASMLLIGRHGQPDDILRHVDRLAHRWRSDYWLGRAFAGLYPRLHGATGPVGRDYLQLLRSLNNQSCERVLSYHFSLITDVRFVKQCSNYLKHDNETFPLGIYFPKALQILSVKNNAGAATTYSAIVSKHPALTADPYFRTWGF